jgi:hypothetical protein
MYKNIQESLVGCPSNIDVLHKKPMGGDLEDEGG